jgi:hypothetical protein
VGEPSPVFAMNSNEAEIVINGLADGGLRRCFRHRLGSGNQAVTDGAELDGFTAGLGDSIVAGDRDAAALATFTPLDEVRAFAACLYLAVDANPVLESAISFGDNRRKTLAVIDLDFLDEVDAIRVVGCVEQGAAELESRHPNSPPLEALSLSKSGSGWTPNWTPRRYVNDSEGNRLEGSDLTRRRNSTI